MFPSLIGSSITRDLRCFLKVRATVSITYRKFNNLSDRPYPPTETKVSIPYRKFNNMWSLVIFVPLLLVSIPYRKFNNLRRKAELLFKKEGFHPL